MKKPFILIPIAIILILGAAFLVISPYGGSPVGGQGQGDGSPSSLDKTGATERQEGDDAGATQQEQIIQENRVDFSQFNSLFRFSAEVPEGWEVEFVPQITSLNIYDPQNPNEGVREKSQIFIRYFQANRFLTLSTVAISVQEDTEVNGHDAVRYEITKKPGVADFPNQPSWRNNTHKLTDIRFTKNSPSLFYVFSYAPALGTEAFEDFVDSLLFHNDLGAILPPLDRSLDRITKKPFGIEISPENSPVQPERFSGYHTGADFEIFNEEQHSEVKISAICGGKLRQKQNSQGYGGVAIQDCLLSDQPVTVLYGHLALASITSQVGEYLAPGDEIGTLGAPQSSQTDGERKHLHLGIHKGTSIDIRGYVVSEPELASWINPLDYIGKE